MRADKRGEGETRLFFGSRGSAPRTPPSGGPPGALRGLSEGPPRALRGPSGGAPAGRLRRAARIDDRESPSLEEETKTADQLEHPQTQKKGGRTNNKQPRGRTKQKRNSQPGTLKGREPDHSLSLSFCLSVFLSLRQTPLSDSLSFCLSASPSLKRGIGNTDNADRLSRRGQHPHVRGG